MKKSFLTRVQTLGNGQLLRLGPFALILLWASILPAFGQYVVVDFNAPGQLVNNFFLFGGPNFVESTTGGAGGSGDVNLTTSTDSTITYTNRTFDFSAAGAVMHVGVSMKANTG